MFCFNCGTKLPDEANFCWKCGKPQKAGLQTEEPRWERCEIVYEVLKGWPIKYRFWAEAIDAEGTYNAGESEVVRGSYPIGDNCDQVPCKKLIKKLVSDGWENVGRGDKWYSYKFRRRMQ